MSDLHAKYIAFETLAAWGRHLGMKRLLVVLFLFSFWQSAMAQTPVRELRARDGATFKNVTVINRDQAKVSFNHDDGITTLPLGAFDDANLELIIPGHLAAVKARQEEADAKRRQWEQARDAQRKEALAKDPAAAARARKEDDIREVAIRYVLTHFEAPDLTKVLTILLEIDRDTPSDEFLQRFATHKPPVQKLPRSRPRNDGFAENVLLCHISSLKWLSETEVEIGAARTLGESGVAFRYTLKQTATGWEVVQSRVTAIT